MGAECSVSETPGLSYLEIDDSEEETVKYRCRCPPVESARGNHMCKLFVWDCPKNT